MSKSTDERPKNNSSKTENFWLVTPRSKNITDVWLKDLKEGKELSILRKKIPSFNKPDEFFQALFDSKIPLTRAVWFIKITLYYTNLKNDQSKKKKIFCFLDGIFRIFFKVHLNGIIPGQKSFYWNIRLIVYNFKNSAPFSARNF